MCNQYYNQAGFSTPFTTQSTDMEAKNVFQHDQIIRQIDVLNNSVQSYSEQMEKRFQYIERKKRRSCTQKYLSQRTKVNCKIYRFEKLETVGSNLG